MTGLRQNQETFVDEMLEGFVAAHGKLIRRVTGGVVRRRSAPVGEVAVVVGGGSGHYPAFAGLVGDGLAHGAAMGNIFASPSAHQVFSVAETAHSGGGVLLTYGNYAGDVLNFDAAEDRLRRAGIACETVRVTDDVCSAPRERRSERRGIAGNLMVFLAAAAAAEQGKNLAEVSRIARLANERTRSFGVAFSGCTLPGAGSPLFTVPPDSMAIGLGIHGEPGVEIVPAPDPQSLADILVTRLMAERPDSVDPAHQRVVPMLNGLGALKNEELYVVFGHITRILSDAGIEVVDPHVGEYCTSFDMCGLSLTLYWLDDELASLWGHPVNAPGYHTAARSTRDAETQPDDVSHTADSPLIPSAAILSSEADDDSRACAHVIVTALEAVADVVDDHAEELGRIDAIAGDGDHGIGMQRGAHAARTAAQSAAEAGAGAQRTLAAAADAWADKGGGTSGALWGVILNSVASTLSNTGAPSAGSVALGVTRAREAVMEYGKADIGDKTLVDALVPFDRELTERVTAGEHLVASWRTAATEARIAAANTANLTPRKGRARLHGVHAQGTPDAGAYSLALIVTAIGDVLQRTTPSVSTPETQRKAST